MTGFKDKKAISRELDGLAKDIPQCSTVVDDLRTWLLQRFQGSTELGHVTLYKMFQFQFCKLRELRIGEHGRGIS